MNMKNIPVALLSPVLFFALLFVYTKVAGPLPLSVSSVVTQKTDTFAVTGEGKVSVIPDIAKVSIGVESQGPTAKQVRDDLNQRINAVSDAVKQLGIDAKDIQTTNYSIYPTYDYSNGKQRITGYQASTNLSITVRDMDKANTVLDTATDKGANTVGGITFDVADRTASENEARQKAFQEAHKKAEMAAQIAGFKLGRVINYSENAGGQPYPIMYDKVALEARAQAAPGAEIQPGSQEIVLNVTISYEIE